MLILIDRARQQRLHGRLLLFNKCAHAISATTQFSPLAAPLRRSYTRPGTPMMRVAKIALLAPMLDAKTPSAYRDVRRMSGREAYSMIVPPPAMRAVRGVSTALAKRFTAASRSTIFTPSLISIFLSAALIARFHLISRR